ncbi:MAG: endonuclease/exonuclease/phosphatase family protein, partial [Rhodoblastus sp.]
MIVVSWNINSVRLRLPLLLDYLKAHAPDVVCLQELKCTDEQFPRAEIEDAGYNALVAGQKSW